MSLTAKQVTTKTHMYLMKTMVNHAVTITRVVCSFQLTSSSKLINPVGAAIAALFYASKTVKT
jgi:hypothetical protein